MVEHTEVDNTCSNVDILLNYGFYLGK